MDFFIFAIYSIIILIVLHFVFYYHNIDIIDLIFGNKQTQTQKESINECETEQPETLETSVLGEPETPNVNNEKHINELLQGLEELNKDK